MDGSGQHTLSVFESFHFEHFSWGSFILFLLVLILLLNLFYSVSIKFVVVLLVLGPFALSLGVQVSRDRSLVVVVSWSK